MIFAFGMPIVIITMSMIVLVGFLNRLQITSISIACHSTTYQIGSALRFELAAFDLLLIIIQSESRCYLKILHRFSYTLI